MRKILLCALFAAALALPAGAQLVEGVLVEPQHPTTSDPIRLTVVESGGCPLFFQEPFYEPATGAVVLRASLPGCPPPLPNPSPIRRTFEIGPLPAGRHLAEVRIETLPGYNWKELFEVSEDTAQLGLQDGRFQASVHWSIPHGGSSGAGHARRLARNSGAFWFFSPDNLEVTVKVLDGRAINGHWWVFIASMTDLPLEIRIDKAGGAFKTYVQTAGANRNFIDISAFEEGPPPPAAGPVSTEPTTPTTLEIAVDPERPTAADPVHVEVAVLNTEPDLTYDGRSGQRFGFHYNTYFYPDLIPPLQPFTAGTTAGPLAPGVYTVEVLKDGLHDFGRTFEVTAASPALRLRETDEDHFDIEVSFRLPGESQLRSAPGVPLTRDAGYFYFFDRENAEVTVKIVDGHAVNGHWWVFLASMTTLELEIEVTRCPPEGLAVPCVTKTYVQPAGQNRSFLDTSTF